MINSKMPSALEMSDAATLNNPTLDYTTPDLVSLLRFSNILAGIEFKAHMSNDDSQITLILSDLGTMTPSVSSHPFISDGGALQTLYRRRFISFCLSHCHLSLIELTKLLSTT